MRPPSVFVRELLPEEGNRLKRLSRKAASEVKRERGLICWASATRMSAQQIAALVGTDESQVRKVIHAFNERGFPATRWSLKRLARHLREQQIVEVSPAHLGRILAAAGLSFQRTRTWKASYAEAPDNGVVISFDQMGPISLRPTAGAGWALRQPPERQRATFNRRHGTRYVFGACDVHADRLRVRPRAGAAATTSSSCARSAPATQHASGSPGSRTTSRPTGPPTSAPSRRPTTSSSNPCRSRSRLPRRAARRRGRAAAAP